MARWVMLFLIIAVMESSKIVSGSHVVAMMAFGIAVIAFIQLVRRTDRHKV